MSKARLAGVFYLLNFVMGSLALVFVGRQLAGYTDAAVFIAACCYVVVTLLFYGLFKPVNRRLSAVAALVSLVACLMSAVSALHVPLPALNALAFFGVYCVLIGYLIIRSTFLPRVLGGLMAIGGLSWMTFLAPPLARFLSPYNFAPGILAEGALTVWLLLFGANLPTR